jgi:hypothetical protein
MSYYPIRKRVFTPAIIETNQSADLRAHSELAGMSDGSRWVEVGTDALPVDSRYHTSLVYAGKMWVIGGYTNAGVYTQHIYYSTDGITWTDLGNMLPVGVIQHTSVVYNGKMWVIGGDDTGGAKRRVYYSTDGITWTSTSATALPVASMYHASVVYNGKMWVIGGSTGAANVRTVYYSTDGLTWTSLGNVLPAPLSVSGCVVYNGKMWVIGGYDDVLAVSTRTVYYSTDGTTWTSLGDMLPVGGMVWVRAIVYNGKMWVIGGNLGGANTRKAYYSSDGITWTEAGVNALPVATRYHGISVYQGKMWVIGGNDPGVRKVYSTIPQTSGLVVDGPRYLKRTPTAVSYAALRSDHYIGVTSTAALRTITLPAVADAYAGKEYIIADESGVCSVQTIVIQAAGAELIDGVNTFVMNSNYQSTTVVCNGTSWGVV